MYIMILWIILACCGFTITGVDTSSDPETCISSVTGDSSIVKIPYCVLAKRDVRLSCPKGEIIVLSSLQLAMKTSRASCMKRIVDSENEFCCFIQMDDVLYNTHCLQQFWNKEDTMHYHNFTTRALKKCKNTSQCVLEVNMFANIQKEIPKSNKYASYFNVNYQCVKATSSPIHLCSTLSAKGTTIDIKSNIATEPSSNHSCNCRVMSRGGDVIVKAVDVRTTHSGLTMTSGRKSKNISIGHIPLFGYVEIFSGRNVKIALQYHSSITDDNIWLQVSGSNGKDVNVTCGEITSLPERTPTLPGTVKIATNRAVSRVLGGYWPLIYVAAGSFFTIIVVACILCVIVIHDKRRKKKRRVPSCGYPCVHYPAVHCVPAAAYDLAYATVRDDTLPRGEQQMQRSSSNNDAESPYPRSTSMRSIRPPSVPPPPPPNIPGKSGESSSAGSYYQFNTTPGASCDVSELEAFLECKDASGQRPRSPRADVIVDDPGFTTMSHQRAVSRFVYD